MEEGEAFLVGRVDRVLDFVKGSFDGLELSPGQLQRDPRQLKWLSRFHREF